MIQKISALADKVELWRREGKVKKNKGEGKTARTTNGQERKKPSEKNYKRSNCPITQKSTIIFNQTTQ